MQTKWAMEKAGKLVEGIPRVMDAGDRRALTIVAVADELDRAFEKGKLEGQASIYSPPGWLPPEQPPAVRPIGWHNWPFPNSPATASPPEEEKRNRQIAFEELAAKVSKLEENLINTRNTLCQSVARLEVRVEKLAKGAIADLRQWLEEANEIVKEAD